MLNSNWGRLFSMVYINKLDTIQIPEGYGGGHIYAEYVAGSQDTSSWELYFDGWWDEGPGELKLVD